ncbi:MAG: hypothetical protein KA099_00570 [Alphaproteobacteria bacterium]|nr:hypothetical protein [Alphaproteobacteria bacterium]MBP7757938.1 hypothetical protein [Alphaproteobacteria bacterium]MBP7761265.1 hypothetical protein [Alphaproteobacteria bacterium]MBP7903793.1 hypothetical protein [Alphaproteobacteria bacterium]
MGRGEKTLSGGFNRASLQEALAGLMVRFQLMCDRNKIEIPKGAYPHIARQLLIELQRNMKAFGTDKDVAPLTLYQGSTFADVKEGPEFESLRVEAGIGLINLAAAKYPSNPLGFVNEVMETTATLQSDEKYAELPPSVFRYAAINHRKDPHEFLEGIKSGDIKMPQWDIPAASAEDDQAA